MLCPGYSCLMMAGTRIRILPPMFHQLPSTGTPVKRDQYRKLSKTWCVLNISSWILATTSFGGDIPTSSHKAQVSSLLPCPGVRSPHSPIPTIPEAIAWNPVRVLTEAGPQVGPQKGTNPKPWKTVNRRQGCT